MKLEAISLVRILPAGKANVGNVTRDELRDSEVGKWAAQVPARDDVSCVYGPVPAKHPLDDYDHPVPLDDREPEPGENVVVFRFGS